MKRTLSFITAVSLFLGVFLFSSPAAADGEIYVTPTQYQTQYYSQGTFSQIQKITNVDNFREYLNNGFRKCNKRIDLSSFNIPATDANFDAIWDLIFDEMPEAFHVSNGSLTYNASKIMYIEVNYKYSASDYNAIYTKCQQSAAKILKGIKGNSSLSDVEKALLIHDRLALYCEYDYKNLQSNTLPYSSYNIYGILGLGIGVCQGYAEAYDFLLEKVGIESYICSSSALNHAWNIVYIYGKPYHVDVTWDDPGFSSSKLALEGYVLHNNFLLSTSALYNGVNGSGGHTAFDYDRSPTDTAYDNYYWQNSKTAFQLVNNELYYIDTSNAQIKNARTGESLHSVQDTWWINNSQYFIGNFSKLASDGNSLFYNLSGSICRFDPVTRVSETVFIPDPSYYANPTIYGFSYEDGNFYMDLNSNKNYDADAMKRFYYVYSDTVTGDVNYDRAVNMKDAMALVRYLAGRYNGMDPLPINLNAADINCDGNINAKDTLYIIRYLAGWPDYAL